MRNVWLALGLLLLAAACGGTTGVEETYTHFYGPTEMAADPDPFKEGGALLYVLNTAGGCLTIMNTDTYDIVKGYSSDDRSDDVLWLGQAPLDIAIVPTGELLYVTDTWEDNVRTVDLVAMEDESNLWTIAKLPLVFETARVSIVPITIDPVTKATSVPAAWDARHEVWFTDPAHSRLVVWDHATQRQAATVELPSPPTALQVSRDGNRVFVLGEDAVLRVVDAAARELLAGETEIGGRPVRVVESRDGAWLYVLDIDPPRLHVIASATLAETDDEVTFPLAINGMAMSTDGELGFITSDDGFAYYFWVEYRRACGSAATQPFFFNQGPRGNPTMENVSTTDCVTEEETWTVRYNHELLAWEVSGSHSGDQINLAYTNQAYASDNNEVKFFIREGKYRESDGDYFRFETTVGVAPIPVGSVPWGVVVMPDIDEPEYDRVFVSDAAGKSVSRIFTGDDTNEGAIL